MSTSGFLAPTPRVREFDTSVSNLPTTPLTSDTDDLLPISPPRRPLPWSDYIEPVPSEAPRSKYSPWRLLQDPPEWVTDALPMVAVATGGAFVVYGYQGWRKSGLRFTAENSHRKPTTTRGWYFYTKVSGFWVCKGWRLEGFSPLSLSASLCSGISGEWSRSDPLCCVVSFPC